MQVLACTVNQVPCPPESETWISLSEFADPALVGLTPEVITQAITVGFAFVLGSFLLGWSISLATGLIRKL